MMNNNHGLSEKTVNKILSVFERFPAIEKAVLYGSRAKGNFKKGSDIDLTVYGEKLSSRLLGNIAEALDDLLLPYTIDLSIFEDLTHVKLREHIERVGVVFYEQQKQGGIMKAGWEVKTLGEISKINYGYTESASSEPIGSNFLRITDIQNDCINWETVPYCKIETNEITKYQLIEDDIVFARTGATTGKSFLVKEPPENAVFASYLIRFRLIDKTVLLPEFLFLFFQSAYYWQSIKEGTAGSAQGGFNATKLAALFISIPPLPEQQRIVAILDAAFASIATAKANTEQNLKNARALFDSYLHEVFNRDGENHQFIELGELIETLTDYHANGSYGTLKQHVELKNSEDFAWMVRSTDFEKNFENDMRYITKEAYDFLEKSKVYGGELIMSKIGNAGKVYLMPEITRPCSLAMNLFLIRINKNKASNKYVYHYLKSKQGEKQILSKLKGAATQTITKESVRSLKIPVPLKDNQNEIVLKIENIIIEIQHLETLYQRKLTALDELKKSLLHKAFNGEL